MLDILVQAFRHIRSHKVKGLSCSPLQTISTTTSKAFSWNDSGAPPLRLRAYQPAHPVKLARWRVHSMSTDSTDNTSPKR
jgi:hypothetical protein